MSANKPDLRSRESICLSPRSRDNLLKFVKAQFVGLREIPGDADLKLNKFARNRVSAQNSERDQVYFVEVTATWLSYQSVHSEPGLYVLQPQREGRDLGFGMFQDSLNLAQVNVPK